MKSGSLNLLEPSGSVQAVMGVLYHIIIIIIIIIIINFMQGIYNYIPETIVVSRAYSVEVVVHLQFVLHAMLFLGHIVLKLLCIYNLCYTPCCF